MLQSDLRRWPLRLPDQPIFYPVLSERYAEQIARDWNTKSEPFAGYVTTFQVDDQYAARFDRHVVGGREHEELWVPAEELPEFNSHMASPICVIRAFFGPSFSGLIPARGGLRGRPASEQLRVLASQFSYSLQDFHGEITLNREAVFLHLPYWEQLSGLELDAPPEKVLGAVREVWSGAFPSVPLPAHAV